jgi:hypothetical protein
VRNNRNETGLWFGRGCDSLLILSSASIETQAAIQLLWLAHDLFHNKHFRKSKEAAFLAVVVIAFSFHFWMMTLNPTQQWGQNLRKNFSSFSSYITEFHYRCLFNSHTSTYILAFSEIFYSPALPFQFFSSSTSFTRSIEIRRKNESIIKEK